MEFHNATHHIINNAIHIILNSDFKSYELNEGDQNII